MYSGSTPVDKVWVRVATAQGASPVVPDFESGTESINPGKPDPFHPGHYFLQISPGSAEGGNWWVFVVDQRKGTVQLSEGVLIHTDDTVTGSSCQHAFVDFVQ